VIRKLIYFPVAFALILAVESISKFSFYLVDHTVECLFYLMSSGSFNFDIL